LIANEESTADSHLPNKFNSCADTIISTFVIKHLNECLLW